MVPAGASFGFPNGFAGKMHVADYPNSHAWAELQAVADHEMSLKLNAQEPNWDQHAEEPNPA